MFFDIWKQKRKMREWNECFQFDDHVFASFEQNIPIMTVLHQFGCQRLDKFQLFHVFWFQVAKNGLI